MAESDSVYSGMSNDPVTEDLNELSNEELQLRTHEALLVFCKILRSCSAISRYISGKRSVLPAFNKNESTYETEMRLKGQNFCRLVFVKSGCQQHVIIKTAYTSAIEVMKKF